MFLKRRKPKKNRGFIALEQIQQCLNDEPFKFDLTQSTLEIKRKNGKKIKINKLTGQIFE